MAESFENLDNILRDCAKDKVQKKSCRGIQQIREAGRRKKKPFFFFKKMTQKKHLSSISRQWSEANPSTKLVLVSREPLLLTLHLTNQRNKMFMRLIYLKNSTFISLKITMLSKH